MTKVKQLSTFFKDKILLITGGNGFIGSAIINELSPHAKETHLIVRETSDLSRLDKVKQYINFHYIPLGEHNSLIKNLSHIKPQFIFHFAQPSHFTLNSELEYINKQTEALTMLTNVLEFGKKQKAEKIIHACSSTIYKSKNSPFSESDEFLPSSYRSLIKLAERNLCMYYVSNFNLTVVLGRIFRAFGPGDSKEKLIHKSLINHKNKKAISLVNESIKRDYIYIDDLVACIAKMCWTNLPAGTELNIGHGEQHSAKDIVDRLNEILEDPIIIAKDSYKLSALDRSYWQADISKTQKLLDWSPMVNIEEGLQKIVNWFNVNSQNH